MGQHYSASGANLERRGRRPRTGLTPGASRGGPWDGRVGVGGFQEGGGGPVIVGLGRGSAPIALPTQRAPRLRSRPLPDPGPLQHAAVAPLARHRSPAAQLLASHASRPSRTPPGRTRTASWTPSAARRRQTTPGAPAGQAPPAELAARAPPPEQEPPPPAPRRDPARRAVGQSTDNKVFTWPPRRVHDWYIPLPGRPLAQMVPQSF